MLLLCGEKLCPQQITQQQKLIVLSIQALFMVINRAHQQAAKSISLLQDLGDVFFFFCFDSKNRFCVWTNLWVSLSFSSGRWGVSGADIGFFSTIILCLFMRLLPSIRIFGFRVFSFGGRFAFSRVLGFF
jgi:hypothetical protein